MNPLINARFFIKLVIVGGRSLKGALIRERRLLQSLKNKSVQTIQISKNQAKFLFSKREILLYLLGRPCVITQSLDFRNDTFSTKIFFHEQTNKVSPLRGRLLEEGVN